MRARILLQNLRCTFRFAGLNPAFADFVESERETNQITPDCESNQFK